MADRLTRELHRLRAAIDAAVGHLDRLDPLLRTATAAPPPAPPRRGPARRSVGVVTDPTGASVGQLEYAAGVVLRRWHRKAQDLADLLYGAAAHEVDAPPAMPDTPAARTWVTDTIDEARVLVRHVGAHYDPLARSCVDHDLDHLVASIQTDAGLLEQWGRQLAALVRTLDPPRARQPKIRTCACGPTCCPHGCDDVAAPSRTVSERCRKARARARPDRPR